MVVLISIESEEFEELLAGFGKITNFPENLLLAVCGF
jgi:hypothetical protein